MKSTLISTAFAEETGEISYYVTEALGYGIKIEQERGFLTVAEAEYFTENYKEAANFIKVLAKGQATAISLYSLCDDYLTQKMWMANE